MIRYIFKRILLMIPVIVGVSFVIFFSMNMAQGDYVDTLDTGEMTEAEVQELRAQYGLDKPILVQYANYMVKLVQGDLGKSYSGNRDVFEAFMEKLPSTIYLGIVASVIGTVVSVPLGIFAARRRGTLLDNVANVVAVFGLSVPNFWFGLMIMILFSLKLHWLPSSGNESWICVLMPALTVGTAKMADLTRTTRSTMLDTLTQDYLRTARAKGVPEKTVVNKHALKPAMIPILNVTMSQLSNAVAGAALTESVFAWPGVGKLVVDAVKARDIPMACGCLIMKCVLIGVIELVTDLLFVVVDPRLRTHYAAAAAKKRNVSLLQEICDDFRDAVKAFVTIPQRLNIALEENRRNKALAEKERAERKARAEKAKAAKATRNGEKRVLVSKQYAKRSQAGEIWYRFRQNKGAMISLIVLLLLLLNCVFADVIFDYDKQVAGYVMKDRLQGPSAAHWFGTDDMGRDLFARTMYGARYSLAIGFATVALSVVVGMPIGAICGYFGGKVDLLVMRILDIVRSIPGLLMGIVVVSALGQSAESLVIAMAVSRFAVVAVTARTAVMTVKNNEYVEAARAIGMPTMSIIFRHVVPNCLSPIIVRTTLQVAGAIVAASSLSFLGLGVPVPSPEWGALLSAGRKYVQNYSYMTFFPGLAIMITVLAFNMVGDGLRDALDPKLKK